jgi:hypothetical protein
MTSLDGAARLIGLPGKGGTDGSQVEGMFHAGQLDLIRRYCLADVAQTAFVLLRFKHVAGDIDRDTYRRAAEGLLAALEADGRFAPLLQGIDRPRLLLDLPAAAAAAAPPSSSSSAPPSDAPPSAAPAAAV